MKCFVHNERDAVGACKACGKAVCPECAVNYQGKMFCKTCLESGEAVRTARPAPGYGTPQFGQRGPKEPSPIGIPNNSLHMVGGVGSLLGAVTGPFAMVGYILASISYYFYLTFLGEILVIAFAVALILQAVGFYGFYNNYGNQMGLASAIFCALTAALLLMGLYVSAIFALIAILLLVVTSIILAVTFFVMRVYFQSETLSLIAGIFYLGVGVVNMIAPILGAIVFFQAKLPEYEQIY